MSTHATAGHNAGPALQPLSHTLGAEIGGIDLTAELNAAAVDAIRAAWNENHILLFRGRKLGPDALIAFARRFGELDRHDATPYYRLEGYPEILQVTNRKIGGKPSETRNTGRNWHSDYSYTNRPAAASMLYCEEKPPVGGDTMFCNMVRAYETLSDRMKRIVDGLEAVYDIGLTAGIFNFSANLAGIVAAGLVLAVFLRRRWDAGRAVLAALLATGWGLGAVWILDLRLTPLTIGLGSLVGVTGCEFVVLLTRTDLEGAHRVAEAIRAGIEGVGRRLGYPVGAVTASVGLSEFDPVRPSEGDLLTTADRALYRAKAMGRNQVVLRAGNGGGNGEPAEGLALHLGGEGAT